MINEKTAATIEWIEQRIKDIESDLKSLDRVIDDYLQWMAENRYKPSTRKAYERTLMQFREFIKQRHCCFEQIFTDSTLRSFRKIRRSSPVHAIYGLTRYLVDRGMIPRPLSPEGAPINLPKIYEDY